MTRLKRITILGLSFCALWALADDQTQSRTDQIESARTQKEANLTPDAPPRGERDIERIEESWPYRLMTGENHGFGVSFGNIVPGSSFTAGPRYIRPLWDGKVILRVDARASVNESYMGRLEIAVPSLF